VQRIKTKIGEILVPSNTGAWIEVRNRLNTLLRGWSTYFSYGTRLQAYRAVDQHVYDRVRHFLARRHKVRGRGTHKFSSERVFEEFGVLRLRRVHLGPSSCAKR
jgi:RNA-directed DNA polymerase